MKISNTSLSASTKHHENTIYTSKLKIFNKNYKGLGTTEKEKKQEETQTGR